MNAMQHVLTLFGRWHLVFYDFTIQQLAVSSVQYVVPVIVLVFGLLVVLTLRKRKTETFDMLQTEQMRGLAIITIIFLHYSTKIFLVQSKALSLMGHLDQIGVATFLIISGFGLTVSFLQKGLGQKYLLKRMLRVYLPFWIVTIAWFLLDAFLLNMHHSLPFLLKGLGGIVVYMTYGQEIDPIMWFVTFILFWYVAFFFIMKCRMDGRLKILSIFLVSALIRVASQLPFLASHYSFIGYWSTYALTFPVGALIGYNYDTLKAVLARFQGHAKLYLYLVLAVSCFTLYKDTALAQGFLVFIAILVLSFFSVYSRFLYFLGTISYEIYLIHGMLMVKYDFFLFRQPYFISFFVYFGIVILLSFVLQQLVSDKLYGKVKQWIGLERNTPLPQIREAHLHT